MEQRSALSRRLKTNHTAGNNMKIPVNFPPKGRHLHFGGNNAASSPATARFVMEMSGIK